jgi:hypothetical protein
MAVLEFRPKAMVACQARVPFCTQNTPWISSAWSSEVRGVAGMEPRIRKCKSVQNWLFVYGIQKTERRKRYVIAHVAEGLG